MIERASIAFFPSNPYLALAICVSIWLGACVNSEKQSSQSAPLAAAELRLKRAERQNLDVNAEAGEYLAVASIAEQQLHSNTLAGDYTAAQASYGRVAGIWVGFMNMIRGEHMRGTAGLLFLQPYDPEKVPVNFVHGLLSAPSAWANVASSLNADPEIRRHFQFWAFSYSTGNPIAYSALLVTRFGSSLFLPEREEQIQRNEPGPFRKSQLIGHEN